MTAVTLNNLCHSGKKSHKNVFCLKLVNNRVYNNTAYKCISILPDTVDALLGLLLLATTLTTSPCYTKPFVNNVG
jgi:hypothetical protein